MKILPDSWIKYSVGEGLTKTTNKLFAKFIGPSGSLGSVYFVTLIIGIVQMASGLTGALFYKRAFFSGIKSISISLLFGFTAFIMTVLSVFIFTYDDADVGVVSFIILFSIIPGLIFDRLFFNNRFVARQWLGVAIFLMSGYAILNFPDIETLLSLPLWVWLAIIDSVLLAINELITRKASALIRTNQFSHNFWVGLSTTMFALLVITVTNNWHIKADLPIKMLVIPVIMGIVTFTMISYKFLAYKTGGTIAMKKVVMQGTLLTSAIISGIVFFGEPFTIGKIIGILGFFIAFIFIEKHAWVFVSSKYFPSKIRSISR